MIRYFIKELTDEGRVITPMFRGQYDYNDSPMFDDYSGYAEQTEAIIAIKDFENREHISVYDRLIIFPMWKAR